MSLEDESADPLVAIVSYCGLEAEFADAVLGGASQGCARVVVCVGSTRYDGSPEDEPALAALAARHPGCALVRYPVGAGEAPVDLHNRARQAGVARARELCGAGRFWALFLDGDEVPDGPRLAGWWEVARQVLAPQAVAKLQNHWLFLSPRLVSVAPQDSVLLVHDGMLRRSPGALAHPLERDGVLQVLLGTAVVLRQVPGLDAKPLFWHASWVRGGGRGGLHAKVRAWGHARDRDWHALIDAACDELDAGRAPAVDFVHGLPLRLLPEPPDVLRLIDRRFNEAGYER